MKKADRHRLREIGGLGQASSSTADVTRRWVLPDPKGDDWTFNFPFTVGGAGVREAAFAALYGTVGVPEATAYAASLSFWATQLISAGVGGVINLFVPLSGTERD